MIEEFVAYQQSLDMKSIGFDEPCFKYIYVGDTGNNIDHYLEVVPSKAKNYNEDSLSISQPTFSQAFRWFREKYDLFGTIHKGYYWNISGGVHDIGYNTQYDWDSENYSTYEDAELECLRKLIKIVKDGKSHSNS